MLTRTVVVITIGVGLVQLATPRAFNKATPIDVERAVIVGSNSSRALTESAPVATVTPATVLVAAIHASVTRVASHWPPLATLVKWRPTTLVENGVVDDEAMASCAIGHRDREAATRHAGTRDVDEVELATLERSADIQVVLERHG